VYVREVAGGDRISDWAACGVVPLTGHQDGPPLIPPGHAATRARELAEYLGLDVDGAALLAERAAFTGRRRNGPVSVGGSCRLLPTADGWAAVSCARPDDPALLAALIGRELDGDVWPAVAEWLRAHPGAELAERSTLLGAAATSVASAKPCAAVHGFADATRFLGAPRSPDGLLVVDFSALWAGPLCAHLLGLAGARVVKVETPDRPDGARRGTAEFYRLLHAGHRSVVADPTEPDGRRFLHALVAAADVVIEGSRPRALAAWGLSPAATDATWISITAAGRSCNRIGFGDDVAAGAGLVALDPDRAGPVFVGDAIADPLAGLTAAAAALGALPGSLVEVSMHDVVAATLDVAEPSLVARSGLAMPRAREPHGAAPNSGADTAAVRRELRC
jgi:crotonobetainyl-CoA:carnitine CoA-transferase CaiB-like acyl-CoA transferase